ncbi:hypothetical protein [Sorangium sp. So ce1153]|uniref:hypothetical protein n=1 Tax=Sorangium sp. So ce1153 TaxID=3133333 RepID=UPI003F62DBA9
MAGKRDELATRHDKRDLSAFSLFWTSFKEIKGLVTFAISLIMSIILKQFVDVSLPLWIVAILATPLALIIIALTDALMKAVSIAKVPSKITVVECMKASGPYAEAHALIILKAPDGLPPDATVTFFCLRGEWQEHIGIGTVRHQQDHETYQVTIDHLYEGVDVTRLFDRNRTPLTSISAQLEFSLSKASRAKAPVMKGQADIVAASVASGVVVPAVSPNPALSQETTNTTQKVEK